MIKAIKLKHLKKQICLNKQFPVCTSETPNLPLENKLHLIMPNIITHHILISVYTLVSFETPNILNTLNCTYMPHMGKARNFKNHVTPAVFRDRL